MTLALIGPAAVLPLSLAEAKAIARLDGVDESDDALVMAYVRAATGQAEEYLGRALVTSSWQFTADRFPWAWEGSIRVPIAPVQAVDEIRYLDLDGVVQVLAPAVYAVSGIGDVARISLAHGQAWPASRWQEEAIVVNVTAGYGDSWNDIPEAIRTAIGEMVRGMYDGCYAQVDEMLSPYRVWPV